MSEDESGCPPVIVGLGNPGEEYRSTRHNLGFRVLDELAARLGVKERRVECNALVGQSPRVTLIWPQTYMNRSGYAVRCLAERHEIDPGRTLVVYDEVSLPLGKLRMRGAGGPGGHRGIESVIRNLRTDRIPRLRLGIRPEPELADDELADFVLTGFERGEQEIVRDMVEKAADACESWLINGLEYTMSRFNG